MPFTESRFLARGVVALIAAALATLATLALAAGPAWAETFTVNKTEDTNDGLCGGFFWPGFPAPDCTLREAIEEANSNGEADTIVFASGLGETITLTDGNLSVENGAAGTDLTINGPGARRLTISGNNASRIFDVRSGASAKVSKLSIANGSAGSLLFSTGGAIVNRGVLQLSEVEVRNSRADFGGGIHNEGSLTLGSSTVSGNTADFSGGGVSSDTTSPLRLTISNSTISGNAADVEGGGIAIDGSAAVYNSTVAGNSAMAGRGGGVTASGSGRIESGSNIVSGNNGSDVYSSSGAHLFVSSGYNVVGTGGVTVAFDAAGDVTGVANPKLGGLAHNGGQTKTRKLLPGSPAINRIPPGACSFDFDQRGVRRPIGSRCDTGSLEQDYIKPVVSNIYPGSGSVTRDHTPAIRATVADNLTDLAKVNIKLYVDGARKTNFSYDRATNRLTYTSGNLANKRHTTRIIATDAAGNISSKTWRFTVDAAKPTIRNVRPSPNSATRDRTPTVRATVKDNSTNLRKGDIKLYVDGRRKTNFRYSVSRDRLTYTTRRLAFKRHTVKIVAKDEAGNVKKRSWRFRVRR